MWCFSSISLDRRCFQYVVIEYWMVRVEWEDLESQHLEEFLVLKPFFPLPCNRHSPIENPQGRIYKCIVWPSWKKVIVFAESHIPYRAHALSLTAFGGGMPPATCDRNVINRREGSFPFILWKDGCLIRNTCQYSFWQRKPQDLG